MTQKNNILAAVIVVCSALLLSACIFGKKKSTRTDKVTAESCKQQHKAFDSSRKVCTVPNLNFCATNFSMVNGFSACRAPNNQSECQKISRESGKTLHWSGGSGGSCIASTTTTDPSKLDKNILVTFNVEKSVQNAQRSFVDIGRGSVKVSKASDRYRVIVLKKQGSTCELRASVMPSGGRSFTVQAQGSPSTCAGKVLVVNTITGNYNVSRDFSVRLN